ncbi:2Fe-2S iron-sulfur cluster-binding protein [Aquabacter sp. CN5-332]|uniref:2Fe-2S iron-sulfur cluster-binding protein n=1 Tax=Aquabacter sp. CN5-332 TaxID=3156608 RepID=UPI0032B6059A
MNAITLTVNGTPISASVEPRTHLADFLREHLSLTGTHLGCEQGVCGACTVMIDGTPQRSCIAFAAVCDGADIRTIEGFDDDPVMGELREAFSSHHALQCGFCTPGMLISSRDIVTRLGAVDERTIREELNGNLCRCTGYVGIVNAVHAVAKDKTPATRQEASATIAAPMAVPAAPVAEKPRAAPAASAAVSSGQGWSEMSQSVPITAPPEAVWTALKDVRVLAECLPGAEIEAFDGRTARGRMSVKFGPIKASFGGEAEVSFDEAARTGLISGSGRDGGSGSQVKGELGFALKEDGSASRVDVTLRYRVAGPLAQFSRGALVQNLVGHLASLFADNLAARLGGTPAATRPKELNAFRLLLATLMSWLKGQRG